ncbi:coiled-coil domain-containing protein SCD2-like [Nicotiana tomentosiformis]|uniref:coiled-coil domain-containing protein SCD2-like n=1 Tax=Nicotiana tomentosiformis TaxID=4098 RepID=UPI00051BF096|nr:coiled-coil domain-containing protein SCD2-like [Nicotiana tomentosiformis]
MTGKPVMKRLPFKGENDLYQLNRKLNRAMDLVNKSNSRCPIPVVVFCPRSSDPGPLLPSIDEQPIINAASVATASQPSTSTTSRPSTPVLPSPPTPTTSPPPEADVRERNSSPPRSPDHGNLGHNYSPHSPDPRGRRSVTLSVSKEFHLLSRPVEVANYLKPLASQGLTSERDQLLAEKDQLVARLPMLEAKAAEAGDLEARLQKSEQEVIAHSQEATQLHAQLQDVKAKWVKLQDVVLAAAECESASVEQVNNLKVDLL